MKTTKILTIVFVSVMAFTTSVYAQVSSSTSSSTSTKMKAKPVLKANKSSSSSSTGTLQQKPTAQPSRTNSTTPTERRNPPDRRGGSGTQNKVRNQSTPTGSRTPTSTNATRNTNREQGSSISTTSTMGLRSTSTPSNTRSDDNHSRSDAYRGRGTTGRTQTGTSGRNTGNIQRKPVPANINHTRQKMVQLRRANTTNGVAASVPTAVSGNTASTSTSTAWKSKASNFVYSPYSNSVKKMRPSSAGSHRTPRYVSRPGLWDQCKSSSSASRATRLSNVQAFAKQHLNMNVIDYGFSGGVLYVMSEDSTGTFLQACNDDGNVLDELSISQEYTKLTTNEENNGCWIMKQGDNDPEYYSYDGVRLLKYTSDGNAEIIDFNFCGELVYTISRENQHTYLQVYVGSEEQSRTRAEIDDCFNTIDVEYNTCTFYIKDAESNQVKEAVWFDDVIKILQ